MPLNRLQHLDREFDGPLGKLYVRTFQCYTNELAAVLAASFAVGTALTGTTGVNIAYLVSASVEAQKAQGEQFSTIVARYASWTRFASGSGIDAYEMSTRVYRDRDGLSAGTRTFAVPAASLNDYWTTTAIGTFWPSSYATWAAKGTYTLGQIIYYSGLHYVCILAHTHDPDPPTSDPVPSADSTHWRVTARLFEKRIESRIVEHHMPGYPGWARITCHYKSPTLRKLIEESANRGAIYIDVSAEGEKVFEDLSGNVIEGWDKTTATQYWKVATGSNIVQKPKTALRMHVALSDPTLSTYMGLIGKVNDSTALSNFGGAAAGTLLFLGVKMAASLDEASNLWIADLYFAYDVAGWNTKLTSQKYNVIANIITDADGVKHAEMALQRTGAAAARAIFATGNFSTINALATW